MSDKRLKVDCFYIREHDRLTYMWHTVPFSFRHYYAVIDSETRMILNETKDQLLGVELDNIQARLQKWDEAWEKQRKTEKDIPPRHISTPEEWAEVIEELLAEVKDVPFKPCYMYDSSPDFFDLHFKPDMSYGVWCGPKPYADLHYSRDDEKIVGFSVHGLRQDLKEILEGPKR